MHIDLPMKGLRRNDDAMKTDAGIEKNIEMQNAFLKIFLDFRI